MAQHRTKSQAQQMYGKSTTGFSSWKTRTLEPYADRLIELSKNPPTQNEIVADTQVLTMNDLVVVCVGGNNPSERGTWLHPRLAIVFGN